MEYNKVKDELKNYFLSKNLKLLKDDDDGVLFDYSNNETSIKIKLDKKDIENYIKFNSLYKKDFPSECSLMNDKYREVIIEYMGESYWTFPEDEEILLGKRDNEEIYIRIGPATDIFIMCFLCNDNLFNYAELTFYTESEEPINILDFYNRPFTISINNLDVIPEKNRINFTDEMFETCLFQLAYFKELGINLCKSWDHFFQYLGEEDSDLEEPREKELYQLPKVFYNKELTKFYRLGMSSYFPILKFLTFYQILEYFFIKVYHEELYKKLSYELKDPKFAPKEPNIAKLVRIVEDHSKKVEETEMLKNVLKKFIDFKELKEFIEIYEETICEKIYTIRNEIFGEIVDVNLEENHIFGNIAKTIKIIRNALVHSSYRREGKKRYIPFSESTEIVEKHIPLLKFLAEKIIFATSLSYDV